MYNDYKYLKVEFEGPLCILTLNRPESYNSLSSEAWGEVLDFLKKVELDPNARGLMITGAGKGFCSGADLNEWDETNSSGDYGEMAEIWTDRAHESMLRLRKLPMPVVAAVNGAATGIGCDLALACDRRFASTNSKFGEFYVRRGYSPDGGASWLLPRVIGVPAAMDMIFTGRLVKAEEAKELGIIDVLTTPEDLIPQAKEYALKLANGPTVAIVQAKRNILMGLQLDFEMELRMERQSGSICEKTVDQVEGVRAFIEKRDPVYLGR